MNIVFKSSFLQDLRKIRERALADRVREVIEAIEQAETVQEIRSGNRPLHSLSAGND